MTGRNMVTKERAPSRIGVVVEACHGLQLGKPLS